MSFKKIAVLTIAALAVFVAANKVLSQEDLDNLISEIDGEKPVATKPAEAESPKPANPVEEGPAPEAPGVAPIVKAPDVAETPTVTDVPDIQIDAPGVAPVVEAPNVAESPDTDSDPDELLKALDSNVTEPVPATETPAPAAVAETPAPATGTPAPAAVAETEPQPAVPEIAVAEPDDIPSANARPADKPPSIADIMNPEAVKVVTAKETPDEPVEVPAATAETPAKIVETPVAPAEVEPPAEPKTPVEPFVADAPVKEEPVGVKSDRPLTPEEMLVEDLATAARMNRDVFFKHALQDMAMARTAMDKRDWNEAHTRFLRAYEQFKADPRFGSREYMRECQEGMAASRYQAALKAQRVGNLEEAIDMAKQAVQLDHPLAENLLKRLEVEARQIVDASATDAMRRMEEDKFRTKRENIQHHLRQARQHMTVGEYDRAMEECEIVLRDDAHNTEAIRLRERIISRMEPIVEFERDVTHRGMINEVNTKWRPVYAVNAPDLNDSDVATTKQILANENDESSIEQEIEQRMHKIKIPSVSFRPPATIQDAIDFFRRAAKDYDDPQRPVDERGLNFVLTLSKPIYGAGATTAAAGANANDDPFAVTETPPAGAAAATDSQIPQIPVLTASNITIYEALQIVCKQTGFKFKIRGSVIMVMPKDATDDVLITRSYNVLDMFADRVTSAAEDVRANSGSPFGDGGDALVADGNATGGNQERAWKEFFTQMGVLWPPKASINYIKTIGKLRVTNTAENLAVFERALNDLNVTPTLIEIETRFVEVAQEDLNSLGFEWILNSDYSLNVGGKLGKVLGLHDGNWLSSDTSSAGGTDNGGATVTSSNSNTPTTNSEAIQQATSTAAWVRGRYYNPYTNTYSNQPGTWITNPDGSTFWQPNVKTSRKNIGIARMGGNATYTTGQRYISQDSNHVSGGDASTNDQFTRLNAFLGDMNLSMILHMLSQRSDTDMLSAPKVVTKSGQDATIKVVTEYIYPTDYDVTIQSSGGSSSAWGSSRGNILAMVEPQNFKKREVGVILEVRPEVTAEGQMINLDLNPKVVGEPTWHDYGMKVPIQKDSSTLPNLVGLSDDVVNQILSNNSNEQEYYTVPMEQPFFPVRTIDTHISIYNGATLVMGGLITEERRSIDDKIPFLGDLPFIGRLFRSHAESTKKRNLLIFVTARLIDPRGRQVKTGSQRQSDSSHAAGSGVTPAPADGAAAKK